MSRFSQEVSIVPKTAWVIALLVYLCFVSFIWLGPMRHEKDFATWADVGKLVFTFVLPLFLFVYVLLIGYVNADAKRRGMRHVMWTLLGIFVPNAIGIILYFILRDPLLASCRKCGTQVKKGLAFCPQCGETVSQSCPQCRRAVEPAWTHCGYCGASLKERQ